MARIWTTVAAYYDGTIGWLDTHEVQIVPFIANAFSIYLATNTPIPSPRNLAQTEKLPASNVGMDYFEQLNTSRGQITSGASLITIPVLALFIAFQRSFIKASPLPA